MFPSFNRRYLACGSPFPLTPALSPAERESPQIVARFTKEHLANPAHDFSKRRETILPLPEGGGRGEGKGRASPTRPYNKLKRASVRRPPRCGKCGRLRRCPPRRRAGCGRPRTSPPPAAKYPPCPCCEPRRGTVRRQGSRVSRG